MLKIKLTEKEEKEFCDEIITYFQNERGEEIGILQATNILEFITKKIGVKFYNKGIDTSKQYISNKMLEIDFELEELKK